MNESNNLSAGEQVKEKARILHEIKFDNLLIEQHNLDLAVVINDHFWVLESSIVEDFIWKAFQETNEDRRFDSEEEYNDEWLSFKSSIPDEVKINCMYENIEHLHYEN